MPGSPPAPWRRPTLAGFPKHLLPLSQNIYSQRSFRPKQADALSPRSSANESACAVEKSLFASLAPANTLIRPSFKALLRHSWASLREIFQSIFTAHTSFEYHDRSSRPRHSNDAPFERNLFHVKQQFFRRMRSFSSVLNPLGVSKCNCRHADIEHSNATSIMDAA
jgi:hypothetical protein